MAQEHVEIVRASIEALNRRDLDAALDHAAPAFEFDFSRAVGPQRGVYSLGKVRRLFEDFLEPWDLVHWEVAEVLEAGDQVVTSLLTNHRGREGIETRTRAAWVWTFRGGAILRITFYQQPKEAIEAAGAVGQQPHN